MRKSHILLMVLLTAVTVGLSGCSHVSEDWKAAQAADTSEAYQDFLRQHPDSEYGVTAKERVKQLAEDRDWQAASKADTLDAYQQFVAAHADGKWAQEARVRIENFQLSGNGQAAATAGAGAPPSPANASAAAAAPGSVPPAAETTPAEKPEPAASANPTVKPVPPARVTVAARARAAGKSATHKAASSKGAAGKSAHHLAQLGAYGSKAGAASAWRRLSSKYPGELKSLKPHYVVGKRHGKTFVRLQVRVESAKQSRALCSALKKQSQPCVPLG